MSPRTRRWGGGARGQLIVLLIAGCCVLAACASSPVGSRATRPGFVGADGGQFTVNGAVTPLVGINIYNAASTGNCWYDMRTSLGDALDTVRRESGGTANVVRVWFFQSLATVDGRRDWSQLDRVVETARDKGFRVIPVLTDQWGACEGAGASDGEYKDRDWYGGGYEKRAAGMPASYRTWAQQVVGRYRDDPTVALWSLVNEAEARDEAGGACSSGAHEALAAFTEDMAHAVKAIDPDHLLGLGTIGTGQCGSAGDEYKQLHDSPAIDVCEYHDYDLAPLPGDGRNGLSARLRACESLGKPLFVGESGVEPNEVGGVEGRARVYRDKLAAQVPAGIAGFVMWGWSATGHADDDEFGIGPGDPSLPVLGDFRDNRR